MSCYSDRARVLAPPRRGIALRAGAETAVAVGVRALAVFFPFVVGVGLAYGGAATLAGAFVVFVLLSVVEVALHASGIGARLGSGDADVPLVDRHAQTQLRIYAVGHLLLFPFAWWLVATRALTGALSAEVGRVVEQTFGVDTFQITPLLTDPYQQSTNLTLNPTARVTIGKRISDRIFLTYARSLSSSTRDQIILLEFDESESLSWVLSQNEDRTYALEVRKRHAF
jgi:hypothetical protein